MEIAYQLFRAWQFLGAVDSMLWIWYFYQHGIGVFVDHNWCEWHSPQSRMFASPPSEDSFTGY